MGISKTIDQQPHCYRVCQANQKVTPRVAFTEKKLQRATNVVCPKPNQHMHLHGRLSWSNSNIPFALIKTTFSLIQLLHARHYNLS